LKLINHHQVLILLIALTYLFSSHATAETILFWGNYKKAPKIYLDKEKKPKGILVDIAELLSVETGIEFSFQLATWARAYQQSLHTKEKNTGIIGIKKNHKRLQVFDFSDPIYNDSNFLVVLKSRNLQINSIEELKGLIVAYNRNAYFGKKFEDAKKYFIDAADTNNTLRLKKLLAGRIDAALLGGPGKNGLNMALTQDASLIENKDKFTLLPIKFATLDHIAFAKNLNQKETIIRLNKAIKELKKNGKIQTIINNSYK